MAKRFINDDAKLRHGGRKAPQISKQSLRDIIISKAKQIDLAEFNWQVKNIGGFPSAGSVSAEELNIATTIIVQTLDTDNKFGFEWNNFYPYTPGGNPAPNDLRGMHTLNNGFTFLGFETAGDEQMPAFGIMYYDGKKLRLYFPSYGNYVNLDFKCALGSEWDAAKEAQLETQYRNLGIWDNSDESLFEYGYPNWAALYCKKYGLGFYDCFDWKNINWDAIREDIEARIEIV